MRSRARRTSEAESPINEVRPSRPYPIVVRNQESGLFRETVSGPDGTFLMSGMNPEVCTKSAELVGFRKYHVVSSWPSDVPRSSRSGSSWGEIAETVTVTGESPIVDTSSKAIGGNVSAKEFVDLPSFNRNFTGYLALVPGVVSTVSATTFGADSISVAGQNVRNVNYTMDGSNNNDTFNGGNGGAQARVPVEAVQEFQLLTSQFDAEFGLASGSVVNSVSKQVLNQFHGSAFVFWQDESLTSKDYFAEQGGFDKPQTQQQQWGGTVGGPIIQNKMHFFGSLERIVLDGGVTTLDPEPAGSRAHRLRGDAGLGGVRGSTTSSTRTRPGACWLRETSPPSIQINAENHTPHATRPRPTSTGHWSPASARCWARTSEHLPRVGGE